MSQPIPDRLIRNLARAPDLSANLTPSRIMKARLCGAGSLEPDELPPRLVRVLALVCQGYTDREIADQTHYAVETIKDRTKALMAVFRARNRTHLAALAVAQGYVDMNIAG